MKKNKIRIEKYQKDSALNIVIENNGKFLNFIFFLIKLNWTILTCYIFYLLLSSGSIFNESSRIFTTNPIYLPLAILAINWLILFFFFKPLLIAWSILNIIFIAQLFIIDPSPNQPIWFNSLIIVYYLFSLTSLSTCWLYGSKRNI